MVHCFHQAEHHSVMSFVEDGSRWFGFFVWFLKFFVLLVLVGFVLLGFLGAGSGGVGCGLLCCFVVLLFLCWLGFWCVFFFNSRMYHNPFRNHKRSLGKNKDALQVTAGCYCQSFSFCSDSTKQWVLKTT